MSNKKAKVTKNKFLIPDEPVSNAASKRVEDSLTEVINPNDIITTSSISASHTDEYLEDDERFLSDDTAIIEEIDMAIFQQTDRVIAWEIHGFLKDNGKPRNKFSLKNDPPLFVLKSSTGEEAEFIITEELSRSLAELFSNVNNAYIGVNSLKTSNDFWKKSNKEKINSIFTWAKVHPTRVFITFLILIFIISPLFL